MSKGISSVSTSMKELLYLTRRKSGRIKHFFANSSFLVIWLVLSALSNHLPRPNYIFVKLLLRLDSYLFYMGRSFIGSVTFLFCLIAGSWLLYVKYYTKKKFHPPNLNFTTENYEAIEYNSEESYIGSPRDKTFGLVKLKNYLKSSKSYEPYKCWTFAPPILLAFSWFIINILYKMKEPINKPKTIIAVLFVALFHFLVPIIIGLWLLLFQAPGSLRMYSLSMGFQNIIVLLTSIVFPNTPPIYIKVHGENKAPTYDMIFTDAIIIEDMKVGMAWYRAIYLTTPNKFASMPSMHSAMAALSFFFVSYYSSWNSFKLLSLAYLFAQWWSALYLDLHWRLDLLVGLLYSIIIFTFITNWKSGLPEVDKSFIKARLRRENHYSSTLGMKLFKNTRFQKHFDPLV